MGIGFIIQDAGFIWSRVPNVTGDILLGSKDIAAQITKVVMMEPAPEGIGTFHNIVRGNIP